LPSRSSIAAPASEALAAILIPWIAILFGWHWSFVFAGALGFVWLFFWLRVSHPLDRHPRVTPAEVALIREGHEAPEESSAKGIQRWLRLAGDRNVWGVILGRALTDPIGWFLCILAAAVSQRRPRI
jgi:ACS family hexuronate transporter-like MFS transporter